MSAFVVETKTIDRIVSHFVLVRGQEVLLEKAKKDFGFNLERKAVMQFMGKPFPEKGIQDFALALYRMNYQAVNERYQENGVPPSAEGFTCRITVSTPIQALKALKCFIYQCSEGNVPESPLYKFVDELCGAWAMDIIRRMPEYDQADWG